MSSTWKCILLHKFSTICLNEKLSYGIRGEEAGVHRAALLETCFVVVESLAPSTGSNRAGACRVGNHLSLPAVSPMVLHLPSSALSRRRRYAWKMNAEALTTVIKVSRPAGWSFGPILYSIGLIHSPRRLAFLGKARACLQLLSLSSPLALGGCSRFVRVTRGAP